MITLVVIPVLAASAVAAVVEVTRQSTNASPADETGAITNQSTTLTMPIEVTSTQTGIVTTLTQSQLACDNNSTASVAPCLSLYGWAFDYANSTIALALGNQQIQIQGPVKLNITFSGLPGDAGFTGSVNLGRVTLPSGSIQSVGSPVLPNLRQGDEVEITITITGTANISFTTTFTT
jgi:hypothetical protein